MTLDEYRKYIEKDAALECRFQKVMVDEPSVESTIAILRGLQKKYELHHGVEITDPAIVAAAELSHRYITDRFLPDKAIDLIDEAASRITTITQPPRPAVYGDWPAWAYPPLITQLADKYGITHPYQHQSLTATTAHDGRHVKPAMLAQYA